MATYDFLQADGALVGFTGTLGGLHSVTSNAVVGVSGAERGSLPTAGTYTRTQSGQVTLSTSTASRGFAILLLGSDGGSGYTGYMGFGGFNNSVSISEYLNGTQVGADLASGSLGTDWAIGQLAWLGCDDAGNITFKRGGSGGTTLLTASDPTVTSGKPGIYTYSDQGIDDFITTGDSAGGTAVGLATETDTALALAGVQLRAVGLGSETNTALAPAGVQLRAVGLGSETNTALALAPLQLRAVGVAAEINAALSLAAVQLRAAGMAVETDTALALSPNAGTPVGLATEINTALAPAGVQLRQAGVAVETNTALALALVLAVPRVSTVPVLGASPLGAGPLATYQRQHAVLIGSYGTVGVASESDTAFALVPVQIRSVSIAIETSAALSLQGVQLRPAGLATETDVALALSAAVGNAPGVAAETNTALALAALQRLAVSPAAETNVAFALAAVSSRPTGVASESNTALALGAVQLAAAGVAEETDTAFALQYAGPIQVGLATEIDTALALDGIDFGLIRIGGSVRKKKRAGANKYNAPNVVSRPSAPVVPPVPRTVEQQPKPKAPVKYDYEQEERDAIEMLAQLVNMGFFDGEAVR